MIECYEMNGKHIGVTSVCRTQEEHYFGDVLYVCLELVATCYPGGKVDGKAWFTRKDTKIETEEYA